jgi:hypothetical protein
VTKGFHARTDDAAARHRYHVTLEVVLEVEAATEEQAADYAEERFHYATNPELRPIWRVADVAREDV